MTKPEHQSNLSFRVMSLKFRWRDLLKPPIRILREAGIRPGMAVLDFGCGPGGFSLAAARLVEPEGQVIAVDSNPLAVRSVERAAARRGLANIRTLLGSSLSTYPERSVDVVLLYDVIHGIDNLQVLLREFRQVLKATGVLSVSDHHLEDSAVVKKVTRGGMFRLSGRSRWTFQFEGVPGSRKEGDR